MKVKTEMGKNKTTRRIALAAGIAAASIAYAVPADAGKAIPTVTMTSCTVNSGNSTVTATGTFEGIRFASVVFAGAMVNQPPYAASQVSVAWVRATRTSGTLTVTNGVPFWQQSAFQPSGGPAHGYFYVETSRGTVESPLFACTIAPAVG